MRSGLSGAPCVPLIDPITPGIEEEKEDHGEDHDVHVQKDHDCAMVEAPASAQAAQRVPCAEKGYDGRRKQPEGWRVVGPMRE